MILKTIVVFFFIFVAYIIGMLLRGLGASEGNDINSGFSNFLINVLTGGVLLGIWLLH